MAGSQPYSQTPNGDTIWVFKLGGKAAYTTGPQSNPVVVSGSTEAPTPKPIPQRRPVDNAAGTGVPANTIWMARSNGTATATKDNTATASMIPSQLTVPVGHDGDVHQPGRRDVRCRGQREPAGALRDAVLRGQVQLPAAAGPVGAVHVHRQASTSTTTARTRVPSGKVIVTLAPQAPPSPATIFPSTLDLRSPTGVFTGVTGVFTMT